MERRLIRAASLGVVVIGAPVHGNALTIEEPTRATTGVDVDHVDLTALVGSDDTVDTRAIREANSTALDSSGCIDLAMDTSGIIDWYTAPVVVAHAPFAADESMGLDMAHGGATIAVLSQTRVAIFELNERHRPEFRIFTASNSPNLARQVAVSPTGDEIAVSDAMGIIQFYRRSPTAGWSASPAQVLVSNLTGKAITYSDDGTALYVEGQRDNIPVRSFQRNLSGNWESANVTVPPTPNPTPNRILGWTSNRLLVSDGQSLNVYQRTQNGLAPSQRLNFPVPVEQLNVGPNGFSVRVGAPYQFFTFNQGFGVFSPFAIGNSDMVDVATFNIDFRGFAGAIMPLPNACASVRFHGETNTYRGRFYIPNSINIQPRSIVSGYWGLMVSTVSRSGAGEVYLLAQNRIFGGPRQGGFD